MGHHVGMYWIVTSDEGHWSVTTLAFIIFPNYVLAAFSWNFKIGSFSLVDVLAGILSPICIPRD